MAGRRRQRKREGWPDYLYETNGYYYWRNPETKENFGLGRDLASAKAQAAEANIHIAGLRHKSRLIDRVTGNDIRTVSALLVRMVEDMAKKQLAPNTLRTKQSIIRRIEERFGAMPYSAFDTAMIDAFLQEFSQQGKDRMGSMFRTFFVEMGNKAIAMGWATFNPAQVTERIEVRVKRARLSLDEFLIIYDKAVETNEYFVTSAMELALVTSQRREDICDWVRSDCHDGGLWVEQGKSENREARGTGDQTRIMIPLDLRLTATSEAGRMIDLTLKDVVARCWSDRVVSHHLVHHTKGRTMNKPGDKVWVDTLTKGFSRVRDKTALQWEGKEPPTFHEIRSLSIRLWKSLKGKDFAQALAGHKQSTTTDTYTNERGNWLMLKLA